MPESLWETVQEARGSVLLTSLSKGLEGHVGRMHARFAGDRRKLGGPRTVTWILYCASIFRRLICNGHSSLARVMEANCGVIWNGGQITRSVWLWKCCWHFLRVTSHIQHVRYVIIYVIIQYNMCYNKLCPLLTGLVWVRNFPEAQLRALETEYTRYECASLLPVFQEKHLFLFCLWMCQMYTSSLLHIKARRGSQIS